MTDSQKEKEHKMRQCLLYEVFDGKSVFDAYKHFCGQMGEDAMEYIDFEYHFYQFYRTENYNFDYDKRLASKVRLFCDLPTDIIRLIVDKLDLKYQIIFRQVSHTFRFLVDNQKLAYETIEIDCAARCVRIKFNHQKVKYTEDLCSGEAYTTFNGTKVIPSLNFVEMACSDLAFAMKNPKNRIEKLNFYYNLHNAYQQLSPEETMFKIYDYMKNLLRSLNHKITVKNCSITVRTQEEAMSILPFLKPRVLETIEIHDAAHHTLEEVSRMNKVNKIIILAQWRHANYRRINASFSAFIDISSHMTEFAIRYSSISPDDVLKWRDTIFKNKKFVWSKVVTEQPMDVEFIETELGPHIIRNPERPDLLSYPIPNSNEFLEFFIGQYMITIEKKH